MTESGRTPRSPFQRLVIAPRGRATSARRRRSWPVIALRAFGLLLAVVLFVAWWSFLRIVEHPSWPPPPNAVTPAQAQATTEAFAARAHPRVEDIAIPYAPTTAADVQLFAEGLVGRNSPQYALISGAAAWPSSTGEDRYYRSLQEQHNSLRFLDLLQEAASPGGTGKVYLVC